MAIKGDIIKGPLFSLFLLMGKKDILLVNWPALMAMKKTNANLRQHYSGAFNLPS